MSRSRIKVFTRSRSTHKSDAAPQFTVKNIQGLGKKTLQLEIFCSNNRNNAFYSYRDIKDY
jgi:hypothetical protein